MGKIKDHRVRGVDATVGGETAFTESGASQLFGAAESSWRSGKAETDWLFDLTSKGRGETPAAAA